MKSLKFKHLVFSILIFKFASASSEEQSCNGAPLYGYGKLYYNNTAHDKEEIYPLTLQKKYSNEKQTIKKEISITPSYNKSFLDVSIQGSTLNHQATIAIVAKNKSNKSIAIPKKNFIYNGSIFSPIFYITTKCILLDYVGQTVNFGNEYNYPDDFIIIKQHGEYHANINLEEGHKFIPGKNKYYISIPNITFSISPENRKDSEYITSSNKITLTIDGNIK